ncbi:hypothetical protein [Galbitalea soli]|uniref:DUF8094 domain-containing protein n=1 Tax=Galbitalea soli TaxID=1268042 RepID=A0A7C9TRV0_9MICO|nr:hypothetical protein [Galbitalea soli]NEM91584.1 hypothetical protein [Galbitalea soli]NYJ30278.1 hypothetical protein [Galbitalea soli]
MRFVLAIVCFVLAAVSMGLGIAERTVLAGPDTATATTTSPITTPVVVIEGSALTAFPHTQTVTLTAGSTLFAAYGRTKDVVAWVGDASYTSLSYDSTTGTLVSHVHRGTESSVPSPAGSDLWLGQFTGDAARTIRMTAAPDVSILAVTDGTAPAPSKVSISWPLDNSTPWSAPLIGGGAVLLLVGFILLLWAFIHMRRARGPRRSQPKMPKLPRRPRYRPTRPRAVTSSKGRRSISRMVAVVPLGVVTALVLVGCTPSVPVAAPSPTPTSTGPAAPVMPATAVTPGQLTRIVQEVTATVAKSDTTLNAATAATRLAGPALDERATNYAARKKDKKVTPIAAFASGKIELALPQQSDTWPRTVLAVVGDTNTQLAPMAYTLIQDSPRANYKVNYAIRLLPKAVLPEVAPANVGAPRISPDIKLLLMQPQALALAYGDILQRDTAATSYSQFEVAGDTFRTQVGLAFKNAEKKKLPKTAKLTFTNANGTGQIVALATNNNGAIVSVDLAETETVTPVKKGAQVSVTGAVKAILGKATSTKGIVATYGDQLLFYVPSALKGGKIVLLGFSQGLINAAEYKKK